MAERKQTPAQAEEAAAQAPDPTDEERAQAKAEANATFRTLDVGTPEPPLTPEEIAAVRALLAKEDN